jgi:hypothetical protein
VLKKVQKNEFNFIIKSCTKYFAEYYFIVKHQILDPNLATTKTTDQDEIVESPKATNELIDTANLPKDENENPVSLSPPIFPRLRTANINNPSAIEHKSGNLANNDSSENTTKQTFLKLRKIKRSRVIETTESGIYDESK